MNSHGPFRKGDMVQAKDCRGKHRQPDGTVGKVLIAPSMPNEPRTVFIEWMIPGQPARKSWHHETELQPLG